MVFPAPLMTTVAELGSFLARGQAAAAPVLPPAAAHVLPPAADGKLARVAAANGSSPNETAGPS